ncbi:uncharacterized protein K444DRAFT_621524 [Hyaloscypha bicolor E]|uniref:Uncharacterized protein n=1 Tax=Hyaloscypha bicolor E TaxID=1095630 RepID=A0A2J6SHC1_9HELO|nr:uncharacterized protein K444DRAFT_621524 [Hyaloscypha bicolor E]PMD50154.1 hypothetical protein K444DRAFT_621524 [Hyaloscypha bicolor E]
MRSLPNISQTSQPSWTTTVPTTSALASTPPTSNLLPSPPPAQSPALLPEVVRDMKAQEQGVQDERRDVES